MLLTWFKLTIDSIIEGAFTESADLVAFHNYRCGSCLCFDEIFGRLDKSGGREMWTGQARLAFENPLRKQLSLNKNDPFAEFGQKIRLHDNLFFFPKEAKKSINL